MALQKFRDSWEVWRRKINAEIGHGIVIDALNVLFNPSHSTLVSRNVQSAIDELDSKKINSNAVSAVGKTGQYGDLVDAPELATVATTGSYNDLRDKPSIPSAQVQSDWGQTDNTKVDYIQNKPTLGTASAKNSTNAVTQNSTDLVESGAVYTETNQKASKVNVANYITTGATNNTGSTIRRGRYFYRNNVLCKATQQINNGANLELNVNYVEVTEGGINNIITSFFNCYSASVAKNSSKTFNIGNSNQGLIIMCGQNGDVCGLASFITDSAGYTAHAFFTANSAQSSNIVISDITNGITIQNNNSSYGMIVGIIYFNANSYVDSN